MLCSHGIGSWKGSFCSLDTSLFMIVWLHGIDLLWFSTDRKVQNLPFLIYKHTQKNDNCVYSVANSFNTGLVSNGDFPFLSFRNGTGSEVD